MIVNINSESYKTCMYSDDKCTKMIRCDEEFVTGIEKLINQIPNNIAHIKHGLDDKCEKTLDGMLMIVEDSCVDYDFHPSSGFYTKMVLENKKLATKSYLDAKCTKQVQAPTDLTVLDCDKCLDLNSMIKDEVPIDLGMRYLSVVCESYNGVSSMVILLMITLVFLLI